MDTVLDNLFGKKEDETSEINTEKTEEEKAENTDVAVDGSSDEEIKNGEVTAPEEEKAEEIEPVEILDLSQEIRAELDNFNSLDFEAVTFKNKITEILNRHDV